MYINASLYLYSYTLYAMHGASIIKALFLEGMSSLYYNCFAKTCFLKKIENRERAMAMYHEKITICVDSLNPKKGKGRIIHKMGSELRGELTFPQPNLISKINPQKFLRAWDNLPLYRLRVESLLYCF